MELKEKIQNAVLDMMKKVKFIDEKGEHRYETLDGVWLQGVSTVSSIVPKDWLAAWGAKECVKFLGYSDYEGDVERAREIMKQISECKTAEEYIAILKEAKGASGRKSKTALVDGTAGHLWLQEFLLADIRRLENIKRYNELTKEERQKYNYPEPPTGNLERPIKQFLDWYYENVDYPILSEARVAYPEKGFAGTLDAMAMMKTGRLALIDFKFASHISEDFYLQTAGYQATLEPYGIKIDDRIIIRLPKTLEREEWDKKEHKYKMVENNLEVEIVKTNYEMDRDTFFHCLPVKKWINLMKTL